MAVKLTIIVASGGKDRIISTQPASSPREKAKTDSAAELQVDQVRNNFSSQRSLRIVSVSDSFHLPVARSALKTDF